MRGFDIDVSVKQQKRLEILHCWRDMNVLSNDFGSSSCEEDLIVS